LYLSHYFFRRTKISKLFPLSFAPEGISEPKEIKSEGEAIDRPASKAHRTFALNLNFLH